MYKAHEVDAAGEEADERVEGVVVGDLRTYRGLQLQLNKLSKFTQVKLQFNQLSK